jgi:hypothetical protein
MTSGTCRDLDARSELEDGEEQRVAIHTKDRHAQIRKRDGDDD